MECFVVQDRARIKNLASYVMLRYSPMEVKRWNWWPFAIGVESLKHTCTTWLSSALLKKDVLNSCSFLWSGSFEPGGWSYTPLTFTLDWKQLYVYQLVTLMLIVYHSDHANLCPVSRLELISSSISRLVINLLEDEYEVIAVPISGYHRSSGVYDKYMHPRTGKKSPDNSGSLPYAGSPHWGWYMYAFLLSDRVPIVQL